MNEQSATADSGSVPLTARYGLVRPRHGRYLGGVCAAIGRATNTDPVLWRVLVAVTSFFGIGVLVYLVGWLLMPAEGDTASPVEALLGRGRSRTSPAVTILIAVLTLVVLGFMLSDGFRGPMLIVAVVVGGLLLLNKRVAPFAGAPSSAQSDNTVPFLAPPPPAPVPPPPPPSAAAAPPGYQPPFAPHGPFAGGPPPPPPPQEYAAPPPKPPRERSRLGVLTLSLVLVALGVVAALDMSTGVDVGVSGYFAAMLAMVGLGLLIGAWVGRARWLIALGILFALCLGITSVGDRVGWRDSFAADTTWRPASIADLQDRYEHNVGAAELDLRQVDFTGQDVEVSVHINAGDLEVMVPPLVDTTVSLELNAGDAQVFDSTWSGFNPSPHDVTNYGVDGPGGGTLRLHIEINAGTVEVRR